MDVLARVARRPVVMLFPLLACVLLAVYAPALRGGFLWDDPDHVNRPNLGGIDGLAKIWTDPRSTAQYYPLTHSLFWIESRIFGDSPTGYHVINVVLHALASCLAVAALRRAGAGGAVLAAALFALHPVQVESVAWITEHKNTLSAVFYFAAAAAYLRFDQERADGGPGRRLRGLWAVAFALFLGALLSKTVTATLPGALLVVAWWRRGRLMWSRDVAPLVPFLMVGAASGAATAWIEKHHIGATGAAFDLSLLDRVALAGRAVWFYLGKLAWPAQLTFIYPRWEPDGASLAWLVYPGTLAALATALWGLRHRLGRAPLAALLYFVGTLFPALGFFDVFPFNYSFVADHFQYLACLGPMALVAAVVERAPLAWRRAAWALPAGLAALSLAQSAAYADVETLWKTTLERNPACWMAYTNLGVEASKRGDKTGAAALYRKALEIDPDLGLTHYNLGNALLALGETDAAIAHFERAATILPEHAAVHHNLGIVLADRGETGRAEFHARRAVESRPDFATARVRLAMLLSARGDIAGAMAQLGAALEHDPDLPEALNSMGTNLARQGKISEASVYFRRAIAADPAFAEAHNNLGQALEFTGRRAEALRHFETAVRLNPSYARARENLERARRRAP